MYSSHPGYPCGYLHRAAPRIISYSPPILTHGSFHSFREAQRAFRAALCDSFNTPIALEILLKLVSRVNGYVNSQGRSPNVDVVEQIARWVGKMLRMFGLGDGSVAGLGAEIGWGEVQETASVNVSWSFVMCSSGLCYSVPHNSIIS